MERKIRIEGMSCMHCAGRVERALNAIPGVTAKVDLETASASIASAADVADDAIAKAVEAAGYRVAR